MFHLLDCRPSSPLAFADDSVGAFSDEKYKFEEPVDDARIFESGPRRYRGSVNFPRQLDHPELMTTQAERHGAALVPRTALLARDQVESLRSVREYETAECEIRVGDVKTTTKLPDSLKLIVAQGRSDGVELYPIHGLLTDDE